MIKNLYLEDAKNSYNSIIRSPPKKKKIQCKNWAKDLSRHIKENTVMNNEKRKRYSLPLVTREMENKTVVRCHCTSTGRSEIKKIGNAMSPNM